MSLNNAFVTVTYDELRGDSNAMDITSGIFRAPNSGVFEFMFQGFKVKCFPLFSSLFLLRRIWFFHQLSQKY